MQNNSAYMQNYIRIVVIVLIWKNNIAYKQNHNKDMQNNIGKINIQLLHGNWNYSHVKY
jgi:hypothetical protein